MTITLYLLTLVLPLATILIVFGMRYYAVVQQAKARLADDGAYKDLAEKSVAAQSDAVALLATVTTRLTAIEKVLTEVG